MERWFVKAKRADFNRIAEKYGISPVTARIIYNRDIGTEEAMYLYLYGTLDDEHDPYLLKDMEKAVLILKEKIRERKKIRIIGDYDIDGINSIYILYTSLKKCGAEVDYDIPDRIKDGYGINESLIRKAYEEGIDTILTCDNGIAAISQIAYAKDLGMTVIVTDHHDIPFDEKEDGSRYFLSSEADAVINPKQPECGYPFKMLCGAGVAYKLVQVMEAEYGILREETRRYIEYVAIATVGDIVDLIDENRIFVKYGLNMLKNTKNLGLRALIQINSLDPEKISAYHIGFVLGPCLNASGRLDTAKRALKMLLAESWEEAEELAGDLKAMNDGRKDMTMKGVERGIELIENSELKEDKVLVIYIPDCHESLAGIIAGRIKERYYKPAIVLTDGSDGVKGSGRSIEEYNMFEELTKCRQYLDKFGGHPMAAGMSLKRENIEEFRRALNRNTSLTEKDMTPKISIDVPMPIDYITEDLVREFERLEPFGKGNSRPVFAEKGIKVLRAVILGKNKNVLKFRIENQAGMQMDAMFFGDLEKMQEYIEDKFGRNELDRMFMGTKNSIEMAFTYYPSVNEFRGSKSLQITILNYQ